MPERVYKKSLIVNYKITIHKKIVDMNSITNSTNKFGKFKRQFPISQISIHHSKKSPLTKSQKFQKSFKKLFKIICLFIQFLLHFSVDPHCTFEKKYNFTRNLSS